MISTTINLKGETVIVGEKPVVVFTNNCGVKIAAGLVKFTGNVFGVTQASQIQVKLQNVVQNGVTFRPIGNGFSFELELRVGYSQTYTMEITASNHVGTTTSKCQITTEDAPVIDNDLIICHTVNGVRQTMKIKESQWPQYQRLGATMGECPVIVDNDLVICLNKKGQRMTLTIKESQWPQYEKLGATKGECPEAVDNDIVICLVKNKERVSMTIKESQWPQYQQLGATLGACPEVVDNDIIVCVPQGRTKVTMTIKESQWPQYQQMGATLGDCRISNDDPDIVICMRKNSVLTTMTIKESQWPDYQAQGASLGACPEVVDADIIICVPDGKESHTLTIKQSQWEAYRSKGATLGACPTSNVGSEADSTGNTVPTDKMLICVQENGVYVTKTIAATEWRRYERLGATRGACVEEGEKRSSPQPAKVPVGTTITAPRTGGGGGVIQKGRN